MKEGKRISTPVSLHSSAASSKFPKIKCMGATVLIGDVEFSSASEALHAYIGQYDGASLGQSIKYNRNTTALLAPKTALQMTLDRPRRQKSDDDDVRRERKLTETRQSINNSYKRMKKSTELRADDVDIDEQETVQDALNRSADLLDRLAKDDSSFPQCPSDIGSLNTDLLLSVNPLSAHQTDPLTAASVKRQGHVYSYRTSRPRSKTLGSIDVEHEMTLKNSRLFPKFEIESTQNIPHVTSRQSRTSDRPPVSMRSKLTERSRSVSPASYHNRQMGFSMVGQKYTSNLDEDAKGVIAGKTPSWIEALDVTNTTDSIWNHRRHTEGRQPPNWIQDIDQSDTASGVTSVSGHHVHFQDMLYKMPDKNYTMSADVTNSSLKAPGLSFRDLLPPTPNGHSWRGPTDAGIYGRDLVMDHSVSDLRRDIRCISDVQWAEPDSIYGDGPLNGMQRSSSLDTIALLAGKTGPETSDIIGASQGCKDKRKNAFETSTPVHAMRPQTPDTDVILEGDRPWENLKSFKSPVSMRRSNNKHPDMLADADDEKSPTLTGKQQPGSMEALKNMLFKLQDAAIQDGATDSIATTLLEKLNLNDGEMDKLSKEIPALKGYNYQDEPGGESLERAMVHLSRLKTLVQSGKDTATSLNNSVNASPTKSLHK